jgi:hypothetical protein
MDVDPQLQFTIKDENEALVEGATITLYSTYDDWYALENEIETGISDDLGTCLFTDLQEVYYFFNIDKGDTLSNSTGNSSLKEPLEINTITNITVTIYNDDKDVE